MRFVQVIYLFLVANMLIFWFLLRADVSPVGVARAFFVWITVFSVFTVSVFWSFMSDLYSSEQSKRLFGFIAAGGSLGIDTGPDTQHGSWWNPSARPTCCWWRAAC